MTRNAQDIAAELLAGLEGVTPGPWKIGNPQREGVWIARNNSYPIGRFEEEIDAAHIARCDPDSIRTLCHALTAAKAQNEALAKERDEARQFAHEATVALTSMTPGGSEWFAGVFKGTEQYKADIPAIVKYLRENKVYAWQLRFAEKERDELREVNEALAGRVRELEARNNVLQRSRDYQKDRSVKAKSSRAAMGDGLAVAKTDNDDLRTRLTAATARVAELQQACAKQNEEVCQVLGKALGYPWFKDDQVNFPGATEERGVCVGDHVATSLADEAAARIEVLKRLDHEAGEYVESVIAMRTNFTGEEPYVGWKGLGLVLTEALDERDAVKQQNEALESLCGLRTSDLLEVNTRLTATTARVAELEGLVNDARNFARDYAAANPRHMYRGEEQDPNGVHKWLARAAPASKPGEGKQP